MRVLVVGNGGREHALAWKLAQSPEIDEVFAAPGNAGMAKIASIVPIHQTDVMELAEFAESIHVDLTVIGPELPLTLGLTDELAKRGLKAFGPNQAAAELEGSKVFAKRFMERHGIPTAEFRVVGSRDEAGAIVASGELGWPLVVKADGLAAGKGVIIAADEREADEALTRMFDEKVFGSAADQVLLERCVVGTEVSFHVVTDGESVVPLASSQDYKRAGDGNTGPNTGGMGTVSPTPQLTKDLQARILQDIVRPTLDGMAEEGRPFRGVLYVGVMVTEDGPKVLEFNCRLGDPEAQVILMRLDGDLLPLLMGAVNGTLRDVHPKWAHHAACCVVVAAEGYPTERPPKDRVIEGLDEAAAVDGVTVFHAATDERDGRTLAVGGRILGITGCSKSLARAREQAYEAVGRIRLEGSHHRSDIGTDVLDYLKRARDDS